MMKSMTAFGRAKETVGGRDITVEIRSVNSRYFDCNIKISRSLSYLEERIKPFLQTKGISRGKVDVSVSVEAIASSNIEIEPNVEYARTYVEALRRLADELQLRDDISVMAVARNPEVFSVKKPEEDVEKDWQELLSVLSPAVDKFLEGRASEGERIETDLISKVEKIRSIVTEIEALSQRDIVSYSDRLRERIKQMLSDNKITVDENRILTECAIFADRVAIDEELVRLRSHFEAFHSFLASKDPVGRKLDFLLQEMNREINTVGSKCSNSEIAHLVVDVKTELEKIREQIQNIE